MEVPDDRPNVRCTFVYLHRSNLCCGCNWQREIHSWSNPLDLALVYVPLGMTATADKHGRESTAGVSLKPNVCCGGRKMPFRCICRGAQKGMLNLLGHKNINTGQKYRFFLPKEFDMLFRDLFSFLVLRRGTQLWLAFTPSPTFYQATTETAQHPKVPRRRVIAECHRKSNGRMFKSAGGTGLTAQYGEDSLRHKSREGLC